MHCPAPRLVLVVALPHVQLLDIAGPVDVFAEANRQVGKEIYRVALYATRRGQVTASSGIRLAPHGIASGPAQPVDTLLVAGAPDAPDHVLPAAVLDWLCRQAEQATRFGSVCTGAFALAAAGLLSGKRITTHWAHAGRLAERYPDVTVDADAIHVADGRLRTAAGVTAGLDLALALVEEDLGGDVARLVASQLVMYFRRPSGQAHFSRTGQANVAGRSALQSLLRWVIAHPEKHHSVASLAERMHVSPRHFARLFRAELDMSPGDWLDEVRVAAARQCLERGDAPKQTAAACGYADVDSFRRAFVRATGTTPAQYRRLHAPT